MAKRIAPAPTKDRDEYITISRLEISQILDALAREAVMVTASLGGDNFFLTSILGVDEGADQVLIECGKHNPHKARVLDGHPIACTTSLEKIRISFQLDSVVLATRDGQEALSAPLPRELMRLQRREYYRMRPPMMKPVKCSISPLHEKHPATMEFNLLDISCGGIAVITPPEIFVPELGAQYKCTLKLPRGEPLKTRVRACNASRIALANNKTSQRSGFRFIDLPERFRAAIQRYLMQLELERSARGGAK